MVRFFSNSRIGSLPAVQLRQIWSTVECKNDRSTLAAMMGKGKDRAPALFVPFPSTVLLKSSLELREAAFIKCRVLLNRFGS